jgi:hypothetical protein
VLITTQKEQVLFIRAVPLPMNYGNDNAASFELFPTLKTTTVAGCTKLSSVLPIVTANGFTLLEGSRLGGTTDYRFRVQSATGAQQNISVRFDRPLMVLVDEVRRSHLWIGSQFWAFRAAARLEAYLVEKADFPANAQLLIEELSDDEMLLAAHWKDQALSA